MRTSQVKRLNVPVSALSSFQLPPLTEAHRINRGVRHYLVDHRERPLPLKTAGRHLGLSNDNRFSALLVRTIDGDTYSVDLFLAMGFWWKGDVRVFRYYAPELSDIPAGPAAAAAADKLLKKAKAILIRPRGASSYQRQLGDVLLDGVSIADTLVGLGHGYKK